MVSVVGLSAAEFYSQGITGITTGITFSCEIHTWSRGRLDYDRRLVARPLGPHKDKEQISL